MVNMSAKSADGAKEMLHILILDPVLRLPDQPGPTRSFDLGKRLTQAGHRVSILTTRAALSDDTPGKIEGMIVDASPAERHRFGFPPATAGFFGAVSWRIWRQEDVDLVLAADCPPAAQLAAAAFCFYRGIPLMLDARRIPEAVPAANWMHGAAEQLGRLTARIAAAFARKILALSADIREHLLRSGVKSGKVVLSPLASDTALGSVGGDDKSPLPVTGGKILLYAGPLVADSGLENIVAIAAVVQDAGGESLRIVLCGGGPLRGRLEALAAEAGVLEKTLWFGPPLARRALAPAFAAATAVLAPTRHHSMEMSAAFYDGLAAGKPLIVFDTGEHRELVEARGAGVGLPADPAAAARELTDFLRDADGLRRTGQQAHALATGRFNLERTAADVRALIEETVAAAPRAEVLRNRRLRTKRFIDVVVSAAGLILLAPVMMAIAIAICIKMGWPPVFAQARPGLKGETFRIYKFRTMSVEKDSAGALLSDEARLTPLGKLLRRTSLDELPELLNVLKGDMSLVGPRPLLPEYIPHYTAEQRRRHDLRPGITGWSQINGRNARSWEDKFKLDVWYVDNLSLWLDFKIILKTFWITLTGAGVNAPGHATMPRFDEVVARREGGED